MFVIVGVIAVIGAVMSGFLPEHGNLSVLIQTSELIIIGGAALGAFIISSPKKVVQLVVTNLVPVFKSEKVDEISFGIFKTYGH